MSHYAGEGIARGEGVILFATAPRWKGICARLEEKGFDPGALSRRDQLCVISAEESLPALMKGAMPDEALFKSLAQDAIAKAGGGGKRSRVRWWGEVVNTLLAAGNARASLQLEELYADVAAETSTPFFCSYALDKFDSHTYDGAFAGLCSAHSHVIPAENYVSHRLAITRAVEDIIGVMEGTMLRSLMTWEGVACEMPTSQAMLLWVRETMPGQFDAVLARTRDIERELSIAAPVP